MADIRINALATTATTPASDDYLALDGAAQGTRKILATNIANNVTDVILGSSGPSVKSSLSARAPRQGLVFDGSTAAECSGTSALGTGDFSASAVVSTASSAQQYIFLGVGSGGFGFRVNNYALEVAPYGAGSLGASSSSLTSGKPAHVAYVRSGTTGTFYINGVAAGTVNDSTNYSNASGVNRLGAVASGTANLAGTILAPAIYNRALSASEVVALYESGAPAGADYNSASNTSVNATFSNVLYDTFSGASATGFTAVRSSNALADADAVISQSWQVGAKFLVTFNATLTSGVAPVVRLAKFGVATLSANGTVVGGANSIVLTATTASSGTCGVEFETIGVTSYAISNFSIKPLGLLLAPDAAQAGGGLVWYDTSGNAANITLPASGVSWNVPSSRVLGGNWSVSGTYNGTSGLFNIGTGVLDAELVNLAAATDGVGLSLLSTKTGGRRYFIVSSGGTSGYGQGKLVFGDETVGAYMALASTGNLLLKSDGVDSGNGKVQLATHTTSAGGIGFGTDTALFRENTGQLTLSGANPRFNVSASTATNPALSQFLNSGGTVYCGADGSGAAFGAGAYTAIFGAGSQATAIISGGVKAAVFDTSQNATFAGNINAGGASNDADIRLHLNAAGTTSAKYAALWRNSSSNKIFHLRADGDLYTSAGATITGAIAIGNTVQTAVGVASTHKVTISIGGSTYYLLATNV